MSDPGLSIPPQLIEEATLARLLEAGSKGVVSSELESLLAHDLERPVGRELIEEALQRLKERGLTAVWSRRWRSIASMPWVVGTVKRGSRGLEVIPRAGGARLELAPSRAKGALPGDLVLVRPERTKSARGERRGSQAGSVIEILRARSRRFVGNLIEGRGGLEFAPWDPSASPNFETIDSGSAKAGEWVVVEAVAAGGKGTGLSHGRVVERIGSLDDPAVDSRVACRQYQIRDELPVEVLAQADALAKAGGVVEEEGGPARRDRRGDLVVTIDGADAKDFDDAISVARTPNGWGIAIHIADVAHYVREGSAIDAEARLRGTSVYFPGRVVPMLPPILADDLCSLRPGIPRNAVSVLLEVDESARIRSRRFERSLIESSRRLTYEQADVLLQNPESDPPLAEMFRAAGEVFEVLRRARRERGSLDVDLPAVRVQLGDASELVGLEVENRLDAHRLIEELMILANSAVAEALSEAGYPALHRVHDQPDLEDLAELARALQALGVEDIELSEEPTAGDIQRMVAATPPGPLRPVAALRALKAMKRAVYDPDPRGHWALGLEHYLHFTSPIRRYPDLVAHRRLIELIARKPASSGAGLDALGVSLSELERAAEAAERDVSHWKRIRALMGREGEVFAVTVTDLQNFGAFVRLDAEWVDGLLPSWSFGEGPWRVIRAGTELKQLGGPARVRLGDRLEARLLRVDLIRRQIELEPVIGGNRSGAAGVGKKQSPRPRGRGEERAHDEKKVRGPRARPGRSGGRVRSK